MVAARAQDPLAFGRPPRGAVAFRSRKLFFFVGVRGGTGSRVPLLLLH
jgi:hypothetical protein